MGRFLLKVFVSVAVATATVSFVLVAWGGNVDYFYEKFTTPRASSLILGDSRSMQGLQPAVIDAYFSHGEYALPMLNFSFTVAQMAYGEIWTETVKRKLDTTTTNGLFILTVSPWILSKREGDNEEQKAFFEADVPPNNMHFVSLNPNLEYLVRNANYFHFRGIFRRSSTMHKDGWLEETNLPKDEETLSRWKHLQWQTFVEFSKKMTPSRYRMEHLNRLVAYLNTKGRVVLLRMPMDRLLRSVEDPYWPGFDDEISAIARGNGVRYYEFSGDSLRYRTYDGNHLDKFGGAAFTRDLCDSIAADRSVARDEGRRP